MYVPRIVDPPLERLLSVLPAVALEGPKAIGKTATATRLSRTAIRLDVPEERELVAADQAIVDRGARPILIDEWQRFAPIWDYVRRRVDHGAQAGSYLLTGSAAPANAAVHSGAGRIVSIRMRPMSLAERLQPSAPVSLGAMLAGGRPRVDSEGGLHLGGYVEEILASGFPGIRRLPSDARRIQLDGYLDAVVRRDFPELGLRVRRPETLYAWLTAYAAATSSTASYNAILDAATPGVGEKPAQTTTIAYRDALAQLWLLDPVPGWLPTRSHIGKAAQAPKHHLADPALAAHLLNLDADALLSGRPVDAPAPRGGAVLGALFESLVTLSVQTYAQSSDARVRHLRTRDGRHEVDLIVERRDQRVVALEVKLSATVPDDAVRHLTWLRERIGDDLLDAAVITTGDRAYRRADGIAVIPAALLGP